MQDNFSRCIVEVSEEGRNRTVADTPSDTRWIVQCLRRCHANRLERLHVWFQKSVATGGVAAVTNILNGIIYLGKHMGVSGSKKISQIPLRGFATAG
ncbi:hypothetical protein RRF57_009259 [Xylaria bambusicola]|uniref:Uncharacterized protein n=1 Tax=Xylaria bambusicola TaxID=326684 RepID=A0AAN7Z1G0_9PEZI